MVRSVCPLISSNMKIRVVSLDIKRLTSDVIWPISPVLQLFDWDGVHGMTVLLTPGSDLFRVRN
jgi:hypothetical protein